MSEIVSPTQVEIANLTKAKQLMSDAGVHVESYQVAASRDVTRLTLNIALVMSAAEADDCIRALLWPEKTYP